MIISAYEAVGVQSLKISYKSTRMTFIFAILGPNHRVKQATALRNCTNSAHAHIPVAVLGLLDLPLAFLHSLISNFSRVRRKGLLYISRVR